MFCEENFYPFDSYDIRVFVVLKNVHFHVYNFFLFPMSMKGQKSMRHSCSAIDIILITLFLFLTMKKKIKIIIKFHSKA